tara:strand:- start:1941 stop:2141 length:201 start_codon:yes stop_codon:yes gene_type:complete
MPILKKYNTPDISSGIDKKESMNITVPEANPIQKVRAKIFFNLKGIICVSTIPKHKNKNRNLESQL